MDFKEEYSSQIDILFDILKNHVKEKFDVDIETIDDIRVKSRKEHFVYFRKIMMIVLGEIYLKNGDDTEKVTQQNIAEVVNRDRTSFIHHFKNHLNDYSRYADYKEEYDKLRVEFDKKISE